MAPSPPFSSAIGARELGGFCDDGREEDQQGQTGDLLPCPGPRPRRAAARRGWNRRSTAGRSGRHRPLVGFAHRGRVVDVAAVVIGCGRRQVPHLDGVELGAVGQRELCAEALLAPMAASHAAGDPDKEASMIDFALCARRCHVSSMQSPGRVCTVGTARPMRIAARQQPLVMVRGWA